MMALQKQRRQRGVVLTPTGWQKLEKARLLWAIQKSSEARYTLEALSKQTELDPRTVAKVLDRISAVDKRTLEQFFRAFNLALDKSDYTMPAPNFSATEGARAYTRQDLREAVDVDLFYGRTEELNTLEQWVLKDRCRLVALLGMGGIGKTALSVRCALQIRQNFEYIIWKSLRDAPSVKALLANLIQFLSNEQVSETTLPETNGCRISRLLGLLHKHRCLVVLDNAEAILCSGSEAGHYREGYSDYGELLLRVGEVAHSSCLVLTSREKPKEIALLEGAALPVRALQLSGLQSAEGQEIFTAKGCFCSIESQWRVLIEHYAGNPMALKMVAAATQELFDGNVSEVMEYHSQETLVFEDIRTLLGSQFERLSELEREVMYWLAINREPVTLQELRRDFLSPVSKRKLPEALKSLLRRSLIKRSAANFSLEPMVMDYVSERIIELVCQEITTPKFALLKSHALMKTQALESVRSTQVRLILKPVIDGLLTVFGSNRCIEEQLTKILATLREESPLELGYTGENVLNLLSQLQTDLSSNDFSERNIWQADLRGVNLHSINFTHTDLAKSIFAETLGQ